MRTYLLLIGAIFLSFLKLSAQRACSFTGYFQNEIRINSSLTEQTNKIEAFIQQHLANASTSRGEGIKIIIPVVVHILFHEANENVSDAKVFSQLDMLNKCFRRLNPDTVNTPPAYKSRAADCEIEFRLAVSDPQKRATTGIIHKYTPITYWEAEDKMKFSAQWGDDAWDAKNYLNIWVCNMKGVAGYSSVPGDDPSKDGVVIDYSVFGPNTSNGYEQGKTAVHEIGHWLNLKHIWGDSDCGNDFVDDTPTQLGYNLGCPSGVRITCNNGPYGDMYMNYMDYTNDGCINLFTEGQKDRMKALFAPGGLRYSLLTSYAFNTPLSGEVPLPDDVPKWLHPQIYPNPASDELIIDLSYDARWIGNTISILTVSGQQVMHVLITSKIQRIDTRRLNPGLYIISTRKEDGSYIKQKFIKM